MMKISLCLIVLLITISHFTVHSVPIRDMAEEHQPAKRETNADSRISDISKNLIVNDFAHKLANVSQPRYLKELYVNFSLSKGSVGAININNDKMVETNTIWSFENQARGAGCGCYQFNIDKASIEGEEIIYAELRLLQKISMPGDYYEVNIHYLLNSNQNDSSLKVTFNSSPGWKTFDVSPLVKSWKQERGNFSLKVTALTKGEQQPSCEGVYSSGEQEDILNTEPLLVVFTRDNTNNFLSEILKDKLSLYTEHEKERRQMNVNAIETTNVACHLQKLEISNTAISANNISLLFPSSLDIGVCGGHCSRLQVKSLTDYASILSLHYYQTGGHTGAPKRCCVPTNFKMIQMWFYNHLTKATTIKNIPVKATSCGCV